MATRYNGVVKWFNNEKGFGFIQLEDNDKDIFVHFSEIKTNGYERATLNDGQKVSFEIGSNDRGDCAKSVEAL